MAKWPWVFFFFALVSAIRLGDDDDDEYGAVVDFEDKKAESIHLKRLKRFGRFFVPKKGKRRFFDLDVDYEVNMMEIGHVDESLMDADLLNVKCYRMWKGAVAEESVGGPEEDDPAAEDVVSDGWTKARKPFLERTSTPVDRIFRISATNLTIPFREHVKAEEGSLTLSILSETTGDNYGIKCKMKLHTLQGWRKLKKCTVSATLHSLQVETEESGSFTTPLRNELGQFWPGEFGGISIKGHTVWIAEDDLTTTTTTMMLSYVDDEDSDLNW